MADQPYVGNAILGSNRAAFVSGRARYTGDHLFDDQLYANIVRSQHAAAKIRNVDLSDAQKVSGVVLAIDGREAAEHTDPIPHHVDPAVFGGKTTDLRCLAIDHVRYYGEPVAVIVAADKMTAQLGASRVKVDYEKTAAVLDSAEAIKEDAPIVEPGWEDNSMIQMPFGGGDCDKAFEAADHIVTAQVSSHRQAVPGGLGFLAEGHIFSQDRQ